jgi:hypothetical protein
VLALLDEAPPIPRAPGDEPAHLVDQQLREEYIGQTLSKQYAASLGVALLKTQPTTPSNDLLDWRIAHASMGIRERDGHRRVN